MRERLEKTRIGIVTPDDAVNDDEYWEYVNGDVTLLVDRYSTPKRYDPIGPDMVASYGDAALVEDSARTLAITRPHAVAFFCNSCSFIRGVGSDLELCARIERAAGAPATTITTAQVEALRALGCRRVAIGAPYTAQVSERLATFLEESGFTVTSLEYLSLTSEWEIGNAAPSVWGALAAEADTPDADCVLLACSGIRTSAIIERLEGDLRKPVVSAPAAGVWHALRLAGYQGQVRARGSLLRDF
jgi:maleate isomerase